MEDDMETGGIEIGGTSRILGFVLGALESRV